MNKLFAVVVGLISIGLGARSASAVNLLGNPDLDVTGTGDQVLATPIGGWHVTSTKSASGPFTDGASSETFANVLQSGGSGLFFKAFQGTLTPTVDLVSTTLYQDVTAVAGSQYSLTGWAGAGGGYIGLADPTVKSQFALQFYNASNTLLGSSTIDLNLLGLGAANGNPFGYKTYTVTAIAPARHDGRAAHWPNN